MNARTSLLFIVACVSSVLSLKFLPIPWLWTMLVWVLTLGVLATSTKRVVTRAVLVNVAAVTGALGAIEAYAYYAMSAEEAAVRTYSPEPGYRVRDDALGTVPVKGVIAKSKFMHGETAVYDVAYSIGANGLRLSGPRTDSNPSACVLFFGCSFTFGEGLNDEDTMPYRVAILSQGGYRVYNFAFHGYGAQHMLAALESNRVDPVLECRPSHVIYQAIPDHVARAAGLYAWQGRQPRYVLLPGGMVVQRGHFHDEAGTPSGLSVELSWQLGKSFLFKLLAALTRPPTSEDVRLWLGIVRRAEQTIAERFPGAQFDVLLWRWETQVKLYDQMVVAMNAAHLRFHPVADILPNYVSDSSPYEIGASDKHPNARANEIIAEYVVKEILQGSKVKN